MKKRLSNFILILVFFLGLGILSYPTLSDYWNSLVQTRAIDNYEKILENMTQEDFTNELNAAVNYNTALAGLDYPIAQYEELEEDDEIPAYEEVYNISGDGMIGYIDIDKIGVELPIYHTVEESVLAKAAGHLQGSSFPSAETGEGVHTVISAHRGLPSAKLFTDLDQIEEGDTFRITVFNQILEYRVDQILIIEPDEADALAIEEGKNYCTLLTCTPYAVNTHRLLVRGELVDTGIEKDELFVPADGIRIDSLTIAPLVAAPILILLFLPLMFRRRDPEKEAARRRKPDRKQDKK